MSSKLAPSYTFFEKLMSYALGLLCKGLAIRLRALAFASAAMIACTAKAAMRDLMSPRFGIGLLLLNPRSLVAAARLAKALSLMAAVV